MRMDVVATASGLYTYRGAAARARFVRRAGAAAPAAEAANARPAQKQGAPTASTRAEGARSATRPENLSPQEKQKLDELKKRDKEVRAHEQAHVAAAGGHALGGPRYTYQVGPDGKKYAVGGEVPLDASKVAGNPQATIQKAQAIRRAAMAPANPSAADKAIAAKAASMAAEARRELIKEKEREGDTAQSLQATSSSVRPDEPGDKPFSSRNHTFVEQNAISAYAKVASAGAGILDTYA